MGTQPGGTKTTSSNAVYLERRGEIADLVMNRPAVLNAENWQMVRDFRSALDELEESSEIRAVVVSGRGRSFSSGIDLKALSNGELGVDWFQSFDQCLRRLEQLEAVTVAKIQGYALGGGLQIAMACDLRVAATDVQLGLPAVMEALIPGMGTYRLPRFVGLGRARRMVLTGEMLGAAEAHQIGLIDWITSPEKLDEAVETVVAGLLKGSATAQALSKKMVNASFETTFDDAFTNYLEYQARALRSDDHQHATQEYRKWKK